ncbi:hypothetical protein N7491_001557 [Penicillium cf. griseofulvum]|uniref:Rhodopsin domain-containing protein n=1 Tax=Penicillium cf. griseofulvum TaxID=2972120 RepID=A0A9W9JH28_9EURO|nr:hypothetical protein N7472_006687 [Penicillium cf. griseofulvum]KAJ5445475.1 hypothetical protein N7491_001557 [Penicillium cf. griseofulvum]KAJ5447195.1 hypothetical protein N7445_002016 [Penicillium cf. griseofulvum]
MAYEIGLSTPDVPNRGFPLWVCSVVMVIIAGLFVLSRLAIRFHHSHLGSDDWMILASLVIHRTLTHIKLAVHYGYGKHSIDLTQNNRVAALKWFFGAQVVYKIVIAVNKLSFLCLYLRIFPQRTFRWICYYGLGVISVWGAAYVFLTIFQCKPMASFWDKTIKNPNCLDKEGLWMSYSVINIIFDLLILALPIYPLSQLRLQRAKKIGLLVVFGMGTFVCVTTIMRISTLVQSATDADPTSGPIPATIWSVVEANTGIICTCLPVFRHPLQFFFPHLFSSSQQTTNPYSQHVTHHTPHASGSERNLTDDNLWQDDSLEMASPEIDKANAKGRIITTTRINISYQQDQQSDASSRPICREFE